MSDSARELLAKSIIGVTLLLAVVYFQRYSQIPSRLKVWRVQVEAELGDSRAQYLLARKYHSGAQFVSRDLERAAIWYRRAAEKNVTEAQF